MGALLTPLGLHSAITYPDLDKAKRRTIWASFLRLAGVGIEGETALKKKATNGLATPDDSTPSSPKPAEGEPEFKSTVSAKYLDRLASKPGFNGKLSVLSACSQC